MEFGKIFVALLTLYVLFEIFVYLETGRFLIQKLWMARFKNPFEDWFEYNIRRANKRAKDNIFELIERIRLGKIHGRGALPDIDILKYFAMCDRPDIEVVSNTAYEIGCLTGYARFWFVGKIGGGEYRLSGVEERGLEMLILDWILHDKSMYSLRRAVLRWHNREVEIASRIKHNKF